MATILINGIHLNYEEEGTGVPLILLHGLAGNIMMFQHEIEVLKKNFRVIALDSRGHGKSEKPSTYTLEDHVNDVISFMDYFGIEKASILGISMGSYIAQGVAIKVPERINQLVLVSSKSNGETSSMMRLLSEYAEEMVNLNQQEKLMYVSKYIFHNLPALAKSMKETTEYSSLTPEQNVAANKALEGFDFRSSLHKIKATTLVINGKYDGLNPPVQGKEIAALIPHAVYIEFENSGHAPNKEEQEKFMAVIQDFLIES
ncbi:alpha/beta fold hydrolase [Bacillus sp. CGMCC 1.16607]|uniref:alpha/beta fold hydrolase n=1 Tax=Bacillus sp. CGMCC 1.16607 TaxID=3351842 RepID=UPI00363665DF